MAVRALPHIPTLAADRASSLPAAVLVVALGPTALDLFGRVQPNLIADVELPLLIVAGLAMGLLLLTWLRYPRTSWLAAATLAASAGFLLRLAGADVAPLLSLLAIVALGVGGGFSNSEVSPASA